MTDSETTRDIFAPFLIIWAVLTAVGNLFVIFGILSDKKLRSCRENWFILSICFADLWVSVLCYPEELMAIKQDWLCRVCAYYSFVSMYASLLSQMGAAVDLYRSLCLHRPPSKRQTWLAIGAVWAVSLFYASYALFTYGADHVPGSAFVTCAALVEWVSVSRVFSLIQATVFYLLPLVLIAYCNIHVVQHLMENSVKKEVRDSVIMLLALVVLFAVLLLPFSVTLLLFEFDFHFPSSLDTYALFKSVELVAWSYDWTSVLIVIYFKREISTSVTSRVRALLFRLRGKTTEVEEIGSHDDANCL